ncbi:hypothetical protein SMULJ23_1178 [Streptococcus mutans LJ23]|uniref:ImmA/IrrE family metallo-endopeptidase n=1 Tax=Streptococcus mutans TaxID=1309 RepID=UPI000264EDC6|nr:ImmA/IrrE family metallo-endopeptidase [Streptococcus mutans]MCB5015800.1 ImmA/IrrE family metallo-endopeptidase [Streptococcus mutans]MCB5153287.1 ImmA/IrrE family metallo-endopeptidase [Streptococcus mutans]MDT9490292.1 ImmA/IrrE family metallo-endopeptidase [Streptococcus mutans]MDT9564246.1 ImmA/IrrE family metallo-endopeptidase [Streptococcus mutans]MDT9577501.1 ImmA/IrrE family metallo-endopeptidase [Streptococcus mutans]
MLNDKIQELLNKYNVFLYFFDDHILQRDGFYIPSIKTIFINNKLNEDEQFRVILHELGHLKHLSYNHINLIVKHENEANRFMIRKLIEEQLRIQDEGNFNWLLFAKQHHLNTICDETMIQEEYKKLISRE